MVGNYAIEYLMNAPNRTLFCRQSINSEIGKGRDMKGFTLYRLGRIKNKWITDGLSEILSTFMLALFVYASGAQDVLTRGAASSPTGRALAAGVGLMLAVYCGFNASGACVNPCIALMFCLTGKLRWKKYPVYVVCEFIGAFLAACFTYGIYSETISNFDGGTRQLYGRNATAHIFTSFPKEDLSTRTGFFDIFTGCGLLTGTTCMLIDPNNAKTASGLIPLSLVFLLYGILMSFGVQTGAPINLSIDFSGRVFTYCAGYGPEVFSRGNYWFWVPPVACVSGTLVFITTYQLMIGNHLPMDNDVIKVIKGDNSTEKSINVVNRHCNDSKTIHIQSQDSVNTDVTVSTRM